MNSLCINPAKPYPPYLIHVVNKTARSITIAWKAGFNGGLSQSFRIRYKPVEASGYVFRDVAPYGALSYKLTGRYQCFGFFFLYTIGSCDTWQELSIKQFFLLKLYMFSCNLDQFRQRLMIEKK